jgi:TldD protein
MRERIEAAIKSSKADYTEIRIEARDATTIAFRGKELETANAVVDLGGIVRCLSKDGGWGIATFNSLEDLPTKVDQAYQGAKVIHSEEPIPLVEIPVSEDRIEAELEVDFREIPMSDKVALMQGYQQILNGQSEKIVDTVCNYADSFIQLYFANSEGTFIFEERPMTTMYLMAIGRDGDNVQRSWESISAQRGFEFAQGREELAQTAAKRTVDLLESKTIVGGKYPVVLNNNLAGVFIHEAFGHLSESDFIYDNPQARELMVLGREYGSKILNVFDDGSVPGERGTHKYDDEGTPTRRNDLIKEGVLVGRLHSRETAAKMGESPTGNARAINYRHAPIVRMTNTAIAGGETSFQDMIKDIELGVYACSMFGGNTNMENFSFSSAYAYMIRDGEVAEMVKDVILAGNLFTTLKNIDAIGDDFEWIDTAGGCGKGGQNGLPVSFGSPHIRIQDVIIGGE